jgi:hypothetical protein
VSLLYPNLPAYTDSFLAKDEKIIKSAARLNKKLETAHRFWQNYVNKA